MKNLELMLTITPPAPKPRSAVLIIRYEKWCQWPIENARTKMSSRASAAADIRKIAIGITVFAIFWFW